MKHLNKIKNRDKAIKYASDNYEALITLKKKAIKNTDAVITINAIHENEKVKCKDGSCIVKSEIVKEESNISISDATEAKATIIGNTYLWLDSHLDVHDKNCFKTSIKEQKGKLFHLTDHEFKLTARLGDITKVQEKDYTWKELGIDKDGSTQCLSINSNILRKYNSTIFEDYLEGKIQQHSVSMRYVKLLFAVDNPDNERAYKLYVEYLAKIGNPEEAEKRGYFWIVREAALREVSAVLLGSNEVTPTISTTITKDINNNDLVDVDKTIMNFLSNSR